MICGWAKGWRCRSFLGILGLRRFRGGKALHSIGEPHHPFPQIGDGANSDKPLSKLDAQTCRSVSNPSAKKHCIRFVGHIFNNRGALGSSVWRSHPIRRYVEPFRRSIPDAGQVSENGSKPSPRSPTSKFATFSIAMKRGRSSRPAKRMTKETDFRQKCPFAFRLPTGLCAGKPPMTSTANSIGSKVVLR